MKILDILAGRTKAAQSNIEAIFGLSTAFITLEAAEALVLSGEGGVCYRAVAGQPFAHTVDDMAQLLSLDGGVAHLRQTTDEFGFSWVVVTGATDGDSLVTQVHGVNSTLEEDGFGPQLLCSVFGFRAAAAPPGTPASVYVVYLYKRGTFYPFVPVPGRRQQRDVSSELRLANVLAEDLKIEKDKERWMALWGVPVH